MRALAILILAAGCLAACTEGSAPDREPDEAASVPSADAFCAEHGVAEAVCTKCNPKLVPIFQAKGDWCPEHGFPESFCPICHPERGGRPAVSLDSDAPASGVKVQLASAETARLAGIETVVARGEEAADEIEVLGTIAFDATRRAEVNARARGIVREILVEVGAHVEKGAPLVRIESAEIGAEQSRLLAASSRIEVARAAHERAKGLLERSMAAQKDLQEAQSELDIALAEKAAAEAALGVVGVDPESGSTFTLTAPLSGTCIHRTATIGRMVGPDEVLCEIVDTGTMWAELDVPELALARVRSGQHVLITSPALGDEEFAGSIAYIAPEIDRHTRTATARVFLENPQGALRSNLFVRARIVLGPKEARVLVPRGAVQTTRGVDLVFVELEPGRYETRRVKVSARHGDVLAIAQGVVAGERVVVSGSFLLKTETLKGEIGAGCCAEE
ncbi:MAG: efflux RND transporter periplasmic adaptor subunit [Planctomycetota bacterium]|nr:MAG: efflux RND transporter periplasmic adaptor subunit [Planctomycetota bacterium]